MIGRGLVEEVITHIAEQRIRGVGRAVILALLDYDWLVELLDLWNEYRISTKIFTFLKIL